MVTISVRQTHNARHDLIGDFQIGSDAPCAGGNIDGLVWRQPKSFRVAQIHHQRAAIRALHQSSVIMHPGVVASQVTPADQSELVAGQIVRGVGSAHLARRSFV